MVDRNGGENSNVSDSFDPKLSLTSFYNFLLLTMLLIAGCDVEEKTWIETMLFEMESAWIAADRAHLGQERGDAAVTSVVQKYFRPGMSRQEAFKLLHELKDQKFEVRESRHEGAKAWPDKTIVPWELAPYPDAATIKNLKLRYARGVGYFSISKMYGRERVIIKKNVGISFKIADDTNVISDVEATLWADSI